MAQDIKRLIDALLSIQDKLYGTILAKKDIQEGEGLVAQLYVSGPNGGMFRLKCENGRAIYATESDRPVHLICMSDQTLLDVLDGSLEMDDAFNLGFATFQNAPGSTHDDWLYHMTKWNDAFKKMKQSLSYLTGS